LQFAIEIAKEAGVTIRAAFSQRHGPSSVRQLTDIQQPLQHEQDNNVSSTIMTEAKNGNSSDLVTATDRAIEQRLRARIAERFPSHLCVGEEFSTNENVCIGPEPTWIMDPIGKFNRRLVPRLS
jgi:fructose-1,6-bisphosphatase/inositol monophosphatase family enzyme